MDEEIIFTRTSDDANSVTSNLSNQTRRSQRDRDRTSPTLLETLLQPSHRDTLQESSPIQLRPSFQPTSTPTPVPPSIPVNSVPTSTAPMTTVPKSYMLNGVMVTMNASKSTRVTNGVLYPKALRVAFKDKQRIELITMIKAKQQKPFHAVTISVNDPEKLMNTHSISKLLEECKRNLSQYDLIDVFTIVLPEPASFVPGHAQFSLLQVDSNPLQPAPLQYDLFTDYLQIPLQQVVDSSKWYSAFAPSDQVMQENLDLSFAYFEKNVQPELFSRVHSKMMDYDPDARGGPLFLKLLLDQVTTTSEANLASLILIIDTYKIKGTCIGEDISKVVDMFKSIFENISSLKHGALPADSVKKLLQVFQTTSVDDFNELFANMLKQLTNAEIQAAINPSYVFTLNAQGASVLGNDMKSVKFTLEYADKAYHNFVREGKWDACLQKPPGSSSFVAAGVPLQPPGSDQPPPTGHKNACFNCGGDHHIRDCTVPRDRARIAKNRSLHPHGARAPDGSTQPTRFQGRTPSLKWRKPEEGEHNKRIIDQKPYTWDPNSGFTGRWILDVTPGSGQPNGGSIPVPQANLSTPPVADAQVVDPPVPTPGERKLQLHLQMTRLQNELDNL